MRAVRLTALWGFIFAFLLAALFYAGGDALIALMTTAPDVRQVAGNWLLLAALTPVTGVLAFQMDGVFIGATWSRDMSAMMLVSLAFYLVVWWLVKEPLGNNGLWLALHAFVIMRGLTLSVRLVPRVRQTCT